MDGYRELWFCVSTLDQAAYHAWIWRIVIVFLSEGVGYIFIRVWEMVVVETMVRARRNAQWFTLQTFNYT